MMLFNKIFQPLPFHFKYPHYFPRFLSNAPPSKPLKIFPTGSFVDLRQNGGYYLDKTHFISEIEKLNSPIILSLRPHCFGKSLFLSTLSSYYDSHNRKNFKELFSDLYIGKNPTPLASSFYILNLNFSELYNRTDSETFEMKFYKILNESMLNFKKKYIGYDVWYHFKINIFENSLEIFSELLKKAQFHGYKVFCYLFNH